MAWLDFVQFLFDVLSFMNKISWNHPTEIVYSFCQCWYQGFCTYSMKSAIQISLSSTVGHHVKSIVLEMCVWVIWYGSGLDWYNCYQSVTGRSHNILKDMIDHIPKDHQHWYDSPLEHSFQIGVLKLTNIKIYCLT